jgi:hypothetical protein
MVSFLITLLVPLLMRLLRGYGFGERLPARRRVGIERRLCMQ